MKSFIFTTKQKGTKATAYIYEVKKNKPIGIGKVSWITGSTTGAMGEVDTFLVHNNVIPKSWSKDHRGTHGYYIPNDKYTITEI